MALNLNQTQGQAFGPAGANHAPGLVPDPGSVASSPVKLLGDDAAFHTQASLLPNILPTPSEAGDLVYWNGSAWVIFAGNTSGNKVLQETASGVPSWVTQSTFTPTQPTIQRFTTGTSQTYTPSANVLWIRVRMCGGGGGGGAVTTNSGTTGGTSSFGGSGGTAWTAVGGGGGAAAGTGNTAGGSGGTNGTGTLVTRISGQAGGGFSQMGGSTPFSGGGCVAGNGGAGTNAIANTGSGGGGGYNGTASFGAAGGAAEYVEFYMSAAQIGSSQAYTVGAAGAGGAAGGDAGGNGAAGIIIVEEFYS
jgi:hypothetical protein